MSDNLDQFSFSHYLADRLLVKSGYSDSLNSEDLKKVIIALEEQSELGAHSLLLSDLNLDLDLLVKYQSTNLVADNKLSLSPILLKNNSVSFYGRASLEERIINSLFSRVQKGFLDVGNTDYLTSFNLSDEQKVAAVSINSRSLTLVSGGAGTGKTTMLAISLAWFLLRNPKAIIYIGAPTGKAAQRLRESIYSQLDQFSDGIKQKIDKIQIKTIHQLLGINENASYIHYNRTNPLICDLLIVDEASMVGCELLDSLLDALLDRTSLVFLGDKSQLPAIASLSVFSLLTQDKTSFSKPYQSYLEDKLGCHLSNDSYPTCDYLVELTQSYRFLAGSFIAKLSQFVLDQNLGAFIAEIKKQDALSKLDDDFLFSITKSMPTEKALLLDYLESHIILCSSHQGEFGTIAINHYIDELCRNRLGSSSWGHLWYPGRRILIEENDYNLGIFNGDIGVCTQKNGVLCVKFDSITIDIASLPSFYRLAYAISVHKSQGSEYDNVITVLSDDSRLLSRSLLYTAITRAKKIFCLYASEKAIEEAIYHDIKVKSFYDFPLELSK